MTHRPTAYYNELVAMSQLLKPLAEGPSWLALAEGKGLFESSIVEASLCLLPLFVCFQLVLKFYYLTFI